jgi:imidazoleglycerol-phosphate dehydratase/histidinol-phosphatase
MSTLARVLFLDREGALVEKPPDGRIDALSKIRFVSGMIPALLRLSNAGYRLVMATNQDGLGTPSFPEHAFHDPQEFLLQILSSQGLSFDAVLICPHEAADLCGCRKPETGLVQSYLERTPIDRQRSFVIGSSERDLRFAANLGIAGLRLGGNGSIGETWAEIAERLSQSRRTASVVRRTRETEVAVELDLERESPVEIHTGLGFLDHMIEQIARHGGFSLSLSCRGDLEVDEHHTVEDCALTLGDALRQALGDKRGVARYGFLLPMDEALAQVALDLSGRTFFVWEGRFQRERIGDLPTELVPHFFRSLAESLKATLHLRVQGENAHHMAESCFKGVGRALRQALRREGDALPSTKGLL